MDHKQNALRQIQHLAAAYSYALDQADTVRTIVDAEIKAVHARHITAIMNRALRLAVTRAHLEAAIEANPECFNKPRTQVLHGVKFGLQKGKGALLWDDDVKVCKKIREFYLDEIGLLIRTVETPNKEALEKLSASELKRLGVNTTDAGDKVLIKVAGSDVEKWMSAHSRSGNDDVE